MMKSPSRLFNIVLEQGSKVWGSLWSTLWGTSTKKPSTEKPSTERRSAEKTCTEKTCPERTSTEKANTLHEGIVLGIGNPLLDITANVGEDLLEKYDLLPNNAIIGDSRHLPLYRELIDKYNATYIAGGSAHNTMRAIQWILKTPRLNTFFGCVGDDDIAQILREVARQDGLEVCYQVTTEDHTGTCAVLITTTNRSLVANLGASKRFTPDHFNSKLARNYLKAAKFFYTPGFFMTASPESLLILARFANKDGNKFIYNLSATFVMKYYKTQLEELLPYVDVLFGNETETAALAKAFDLPGDTIQEKAVHISLMPQKRNKPPRAFVVTQGSGSILLVVGGKVTEIKVPPLPRDKIVDTNGAGDAFTGGFISQLVLGKPYTTCIECGIYTAKYIISRVGCRFDTESNFQPSS